MPMNPRILRPLARPLLLDAVPGAAAAYSLRQLSNAYTGPVVTVRRSSDNAEEDFKASEIDDGTLAAFCGAGDGLVKTWHDQSGNGRDASQGTAANQPTIVDSGSLVTESGKAALEFDGSDDLLAVPSSTSTFKFLHDGTLSAIFSVLRFGNTSNPDTIYAAMGNNAGATAKIGATLFFDDRSTSSFSNKLLLFVTKGVTGQTVVSTINNDTLLPAVQTLLTLLMDVSNASAGERVKAFVQGALVDEGNASTATPSSAAATHDLQIGANGNFGERLLGTISELILYPSDQTANRERIEGDINRHFGIF
jgi:hypothetical protein